MKKIILFAIGPLGTAFLGFITVPILTWFFSPEDIGRLSIVTIMSSFFVLFFSLGLDQAFIRDYYEHKNRHALYKSTITPIITVLVIFSIISFIFSNEWIELAIDINGVYSYVLLLYLSLNVINRFIIIIFRLEKKGLDYSISLLIPKVSFLFSILILYYHDLNSFDLLLLSHLFSVLLLFLFLVYRNYHFIKCSLKYNFSFLMSKNQLKFGFPLIFGNLAYWGMTVSDRVLISTLGSLDDLGIYAVALSFSSVAMIFQTIFSTIWAPLVFEWNSKGLDLILLEKIRNYVLFATIFILCLVGCFSWLLEYFIPEAYHEIIYILPVTVFPALLYTLSEVTVIGISIKKKTKYSMLCSLTAFVFCVVSNYVFIPMFGIKGAAASTLVSYWVFLFLRTELSSRLWNKINRSKLYFYTIISILISILYMFFGDVMVFFPVFWIMFGVMMSVRERSIIKEVIFNIRTKIK
ncbi:lipopolysaccharide biosynthesis protein [Vibrio jasicida]|uniref:Lipopolysaccharide biosynthesis protein n=1 Tax=Vibrio jasicida TaxID=766224 RepID=A0ABW7J833_9VIBR